MTQKSESSRRLFETFQTKNIFDRFCFIILVARVGTVGTGEPVIDCL
jgi:nitrogen regulatory protein PII